MKLEHSFIVEAPVEEVWSALTDVERLAPCLPGATITGRDPEGDFEGRFTATLGPETAAYSGTLRVEDVDEGAHTVTMSAAGLAEAGEGGASAKIVASVREETGRARVQVDTDYRISGPLAQSASAGLIEEVSRRLMAEFAVCLRADLAGDGAAAGATPPVRAGDVPAEAAGGARPGPDPAGLGTLGVPPPSEPGRQPPGATGGASGPEGTTEAPDRQPAAPDAADAAVASAGGAAAEAAGAGAAPPGAGELAKGPTAPTPGTPSPPPADGPGREALAGGPTPAPPSDAGTTPPPPPGDSAGAVPTAGGAGGAPPPPRTGPPPPPGGRERHAPPREGADTAAHAASAPELAAPDPPAPEPTAPAAGRRAPVPEPQPRTESIPPPGYIRPEQSKGGGGPSLLDRLKALLGRKRG